MSEQTDAPAVPAQDASTAPTGPVPEVAPEPATGEAPPAADEAAPAGTSAAVEETGPVPGEITLPDTPDTPELAEPADGGAVATTGEEGAPAAELAAEGAPAAAPERAPETSPEAAAEAAAEPSAETPAEAAAEPSAEAAGDAPATAPTEAGAPTPGPRGPTPGPRGPRGDAPGPRPRPGRDRGPASRRPAVATRPPSDPTPWGRMTAEGVVLVRTKAGERQVGTVVDATEDAALAHYGREFDALVAQVDLQEQRLLAGGVSPGDVVGALRSLRSGLEEASVVGDLDALAQRLDDLEQMAAQRRAQADAARAEAREQALAARTSLVEEAEAIAATDPARVQWRPSGDRLRDLLDSWKSAQHAQRLDKRTEDELWKRFAAARTSFDRARRTWFSALEATSAEARATKEKIVTEAEALSSSTAWGPTSTAYRQLMDRWKAAGRTNRKEDDALWARFRAAQDVFFAARTGANEAEDEEFRANLVVKEGLLVEAEALLPVREPRSAKAALRGIGERWEAAGKVPRADLQRVERRLRAVENAVNDAERDRWRRSNPETRARAEGAVEQLERAVAQLEADLVAARERADARAVEQAESSLAARREWLDAARRTAEEFSG